MSKEPIYPKPNPEYRKVVLEAFYKKVKETRWEEPDECPYKKRGRKPKQVVRHESRPRTEGERKVAKFKQSKYNWL